jgi:hypothetical protein
MVSLLVAPVAAGRSGAWPRSWADRELLLTLQHDRLEALLGELIAAHRHGAPPWSEVEALAWDAAVRRLLWDLCLHLRLEGRWLDQSGSLCPGHRAAHADALQAARRAFARSSGDRLARFRWLLDLRAWFLAHRAGPDATAYALAAQQP